ncbi:MAG: phosphoribosyltransferase [Deltaproteobacteria bacterium]|nr:phosphoribosyltransferase [Deltaproteobacteria bacterium]
MRLYKDRCDAGKRLARALTHYTGRGDVIVLGLPRGGVAVAYEVARELGVPMDVLVVRKLGVPGQEELAMGAIASGGVRVLNDDVVRFMGIGGEEIAAVTAREHRELERRERAYRGDRPQPDLRGRTVILVDDGLATGATMRAAVDAARAREAARIVVAVPGAPADTAVSMEREADEMVLLATPEPFYAVGTMYEDFSQVTDQEVRGFIERASRAPGPVGRSGEDDGESAGQRTR